MTKRNTQRSNIEEKWKCLLRSQTIEMVLIKWEMLNQVNIHLLYHHIDLKLNPSSLCRRFISLVGNIYIFLYRQNINIMTSNSVQCRKSSSLLNIMASNTEAVPNISLTAKHHGLYY
jgi:hypothetical protein